ncbi:MAG: hypothetical protein IKU48_04135 [Clostridia bacterium]|nr:hypothetical protein [Clostridia bacterium]
MKKILFLLTALLLVLCMASCGNETTKTPNETSSETAGGDGVETVVDDKKNEPKRLTEEEKAQYYKVQEFDLPENFRDALVDYMYKCASIKWVAKEDFSMIQDNGNWDVGLSYKKGTVYHGVPYTDTPVSFSFFEDKIEDGEYIPDKFGWEEAPGLNCYSSIIIAYQQFEPHKSGRVQSWIPGNTDWWMELVGEYEGKQTDVTHEICELNGKEVMYEAYSNLQRGDVIYDITEITNYLMHCRVVVEPATVVRNGAGKVIPSRSYVKCIESTNAFDKSRTDGVNTTWYVDHTYTFEKLFSAGYIPITFAAYNKPLSEMEIPYIGLDKEITAALLSKGALTGTVKSNFPIQFLRAEIFDKDGNRVAMTEKINRFSSIYKMGVRNSMVSVFDKLEKGNEYTFVLETGLSHGNVELARVDFTYGN